MLVLDMQHGEVTMTPMKNIREKGYSNVSFWIITIENRAGDLKEIE